MGAEFNGFEKPARSLSNPRVKRAKASRVLCRAVIQLLYERERERERERKRETENFERVARIKADRGDFFLDVPLYYPRLRCGLCIFHETIFSVVPPAYYPTRITLTRSLVRQEAEREKEREAMEKVCGHVRKCYVPHPSTRVDSPIVDRLISRDRTLNCIA